MNYKAIEAALVRCRELSEVVKHSDATDGDHERLFKECMVTVTLFGPEILRIVRAMAWMEERRYCLLPSSAGDWRIGNDKPSIDFIARGPTPLDAIEAAMTDQQTKGVVT